MHPRKSSTETFQIRHNTLSKLTAALRHRPSSHNLATSSRTRSQLSSGMPPIQTPSLQTPLRLILYVVPVLQFCLTLPDKDRALPIRNQLRHRHRAISIDACLNRPRQSIPVATRNRGSSRSSSPKCPVTV